MGNGLVWCFSPVRFTQKLSGTDKGIYGRTRAPARKHTRTRVPRESHMLLSRSRASSAFLITVEGIFSRPLYATSAHTSLSCRHTIGSASRRASRRCAAAARRCSTRRERSCQSAEASETFAPNVSARTSGASSGRRRRAKRFFFAKETLCSAASCAA